jgi:hypothetical protein
MNKIKLTKVPAESKLKAGDWVTVGGAEMDTLRASGHEFITESEDRLIRAREVQVDNAIKASKAFAPKEDTSEIRATALTLEATKDGLGVQYINNLPARAETNLSQRVTAHEAGFVTGSRIDLGETGLRETVRGFLQASEQDFKLLEHGGIIKATKNDAKGIADAVSASQARSMIAAKIAGMIQAGGDFRLTEDFVKAAYDGYADPAGALGVLNTALTLQWNLGHLENQLIMIDDITTDLSGTPVKFNEQARTRYIKVPGVQLKTASSSWSGSTGNDVDVNVLMNNYAGVPISINNVLLGSTARQLMNEQKAPQLYGLAEYILYTLISTAINGSTRFDNTGTATSNITAASGFIDPTFGKGYFNVAGATLATFVASLPAAMDLSKFPGGDEEPGVSDLLRYVWAHTSLYSSIAQDSNFQLNQSIQGIRQVPGENLIRTGRFHEIGNNKFRKSQLVVDNNTTSGTGADGGANALFVVPGSYSAAKVVGISGTRSGLLFVSRVPLDYTKVLPEIPSTAAIELFSTPKLGITFMIVKYLDHAQEVANMRAQLMWGNGIGDERQLMLLRQQ